MSCVGTEMIIWGNKWILSLYADFSGGLVVKNPPSNAGNVGLIPGLGRLSLGWEDSLEKGLATHSSILAWEIPWTEERGAAGNPRFPRLLPGTLGNFPGCL